jgi:sialic acid synthase SpsE
MIIDLDADMGSTVATFGMEPKDFKELVKDLYTVRVVRVKPEDSSKKRDLKAEAKERVNQTNRFSVQFALTDEPMALENLLSKLITVDHDNKWLHVFPYLEYCLLDTDRILL